MKTIIQKTILFCLIALSGFSVWSQEAWIFGEKYKAFAATPTDPLKVNMVSGVSLKSGKFLSGVGGIAFLTVAEPDSSIGYESIKIDYDSNNRDGVRLKVMIGDKSMSPYIPDWQLIPIAGYVNGKYNSCVSLLGENTDLVSFDVRYNESFKNTLLGIRLLQADIVLMDLASHWRPPVFGNREILGEGENISGKSVKIPEYSDIEKAMQSGFFDSWVLTDDSVKVIFNVVDNEFKITGTPYYYFWRYDYFGLCKELLSGIISDNLVNDDNSKVKMSDDIEEKENKTESMDIYVIGVDEVTAKLKYRYDLFEDYNPLVYSAVKNVMQYSAFFRYVKEKNPGNWDMFYKKCSSVHIQPDVKTPDILNIEPVK